jgi:hypothetical protein
MQLLITHWLSSWVELRHLVDFREHIKEKSRTKDDDVLDALEEALDECPDKEQLEEIINDEDTACEICKSTEDGVNMLLCDNCDAGYHLKCAIPPLAEIPPTNWYCHTCLRRSGKMLNVNYGTYIL